MTYLRTLDTDNNGYLDFTEFLLAMDLVAARFEHLMMMVKKFNFKTNRTADEKLLWAFKLYDTDNSGVIDRQEMRNIMEVTSSTHSLQSIQYSIVLHWQATLSICRVIHKIMS